MKSLWTWSSYEVTLKTQPKAGCLWHVTKWVPIPYASISWPYNKMKNIIWFDANKVPWKYFLRITHTTCFQLFTPQNLCLAGIHVRYRLLKKKNIFIFSHWWVNWIRDHRRISLLILKETCNFFKKVTFELLMNFKQNHYGNWKGYKSCYL